MITLESVVKSYNGRVGCMCGCNGTYTLPEGTDLAKINEAYGYENYTAENISNRRVKLALGKINKALAMSEEERDAEGIRAGIHDGLGDEQVAFFESGCRSTVIYFK